jgi:hypothetical protein
MSNVYTKLRECYAKPVNKDTKCALSLPSDNKKGKTEKKTDENKHYTQTELKRAEQWERSFRAERKLD